MTTYIDPAFIHHAQYRFRCECQMDLGRLIVKAAEQTRPPIYLLVVKVNRDEVLVETELTLAALKNLLWSIEDGHVMAETVDFAHRYTGSRKQGGHRA